MRGWVAHPPAGADADLRRAPVARGPRCPRARHQAAGRDNTEGRLISGARFRREAATHSEASATPHPAAHTGLREPPPRREYGDFFGHPDTKDLRLVSR